MKQKRGLFAKAAQIATEIGGTKQTVGDGYVLHSYADYDTYRKVQEAGNKAKLRAQFVKESHVKVLAGQITEGYGPVAFGLCHGVRRGLEQAWFTAHLPGAPLVIGTEISDTATQFANTVQWDFHDENPDWTGRADFVYSNSWDHAFDPVKALRAWAVSLKPGGWMLLDYPRNHDVGGSSALDPFSATQAALERMLNVDCGDLGTMTRVLDKVGDTMMEYRVLIFQRG